MAEEGGCQLGAGGRRKVAFDRGGLFEGRVEESVLEKGALVSWEFWGLWGFGLTIVSGGEAQKELRGFGFGARKVFVHMYWATWRI